MATYEHTVEIKRPPGQVFAFVTEPHNDPCSQPSLVEIRPQSRGPLSMGSKATEVRRFLGRQVETTWTRFTWTVQKGGCR